jgi:hypothetical protein
MPPPAPAASTMPRVFGHHLQLPDAGEVHLSWRGRASSLTDHDTCHTLLMDQRMPTHRDAVATYRPHRHR